MEALKVGVVSVSKLIRFVMHSSAFSKVIALGFFTIFGDTPLVHRI